MTELTPLFMDINNVYSGDELGLPYRDIMGEGIVNAGDLLVTAGAGNTVNVAAGSGWVTGDTDTNRQPTYRVYNDAVVNKGITPDPTNPRIVLLVAQITDAGFSGATRLWALTAIHGTPAGVPVAPALPASALTLASVLVPAAAASSAAYTITDTRKRAVVGGGQARSSQQDTKISNLVAFDGAEAVLRVGTTPFDFIGVVYDAVYGKWVSQEQVAANAFNVTTASLASTAWGAIAAQSFSGLIVPWRTLDTAGLKPQMRLLCRLNNNTAGDGATASLIYQGADINADLAAGVTWTGIAITVTGTTFNVKDSGWVDIPAGYTVKDFILLEPTLQAVTAGSAQMVSGSAHLRWVG